MARFRVTLEGPDEALTFHTGDLDTVALGAVITACARLALTNGWGLRIQQLPDDPPDRDRL